MFDDDEADHQPHYSSYMCHDQRHHDRHHHPTKLAGGGRDWLVNAVTCTIHANHAPSLVFGTDSKYPLVLVRKNSPHALRFGPQPKNEGTFLPFHDAQAGFSVVTGDKQRVGKYHVRDTRLSPNLTKNEPAVVSFKENNFVVLENSPSACEQHKMVLDVSEWNLVEGTPVNFVEGPHWNSRKSVGGGRDFTWNNDGSIATKLNPNLVLGMAAPKLVLVNEESPSRIVLEDAQALANGETVLMILTNNGGAITKRYEDPREYGPWHYIESQVVDTADAALSIRYDGNFIFVDRNDLIIDVAFWDIKQGTPVNFVGGDDGKDTPMGGDKEPPRLRSSTLPMSERSNDSSESSSSSSSLSKSSPSSSNSSSSCSSLSSKNSDSSENSSAEAPVKEERMNRVGGNY